VEEGSQRPRRGLFRRAFTRSAPESPEPGFESQADEPLPPEPDPQSDEWLDAAIEEFENRLAQILKQAGDELYGQVERDLARADQRLRETEEQLELTVAERLEGAIAEVRVQGDAQLADEIRRVKETAEAPLATIRKVRAEAVQETQAAAERADKSATKAAAQIEAASQKLALRARRQELKLVKEETSKRMKGALDRLEHQAQLRMAEIENVRAETEDMLGQIDERVSAIADATDELDRRLEATGERLSAAENRADATASLIADAMERLDDAVAKVEEAEEHVLEVSERVGNTAKRIAELGEFAERAVDWEGRIAAATRTEADAAQRITDAERRLLDRIDPGASSN
jgi:DNA repair exonuclease SbcCD ATPase subunit